ncbi:MAG: phosphatidylglycerophosphatase A [Candidatus Methylomirabilales bacterium]
MARRGRAAEAKRRHARGLVQWLAAGGGLGFVPGMPGTAGSLLGLALCVPLLALDWRAHLGVALLAAVAAGWVAARAAAELGRPDPPEIVADEVAGMLLAAVALPASAYELTAVFLLFRLFDVVKPSPLPHLERLPGGLGILADDLAAGLLARATWWLLKVNFDFL